jgi:hypothetical protein
MRAEMDANRSRSDPAMGRAQSLPVVDLSGREHTKRIRADRQRRNPEATVVGSVLAAGMFVITLSFLVTAPNQMLDAQGF